MIAYLKGNFVNKTPSSVTVDINGVGYEVNISLNTFTQIQEAEKGLLYTHQLIKEDAHLLFGFADVREKEIFQALISVSGIGAGTARLILSYMKPDEVTTAIMQGNSRQLEQIKGIGKKTAERTVLELKDKIGKLHTGSTVTFEKGSTIKNDALEALLALGINRQQAETSVNKILQAQPEINIENLIKLVLKSL